MNEKIIITITKNKRVYVRMSDRTAGGDKICFASENRPEKKPPPQGSVATV
jgi:hypothetical protein